MANNPSQPSLFAKNLVAALLPYFQAYDYPSEAVAQTEVLESLNSYGATTRGGMLHAALAVAFGFSALEALAEAKQNPDLSPTQTQRIRAGASTLSRACQQNARLAVSHPVLDAPATRADDKPAAKSAPVRRPGPAALPPDLSDADIADILQQADATINACRNRLAPPGRPASQHRDSALAQLFVEAARTAVPLNGAAAGPPLHPQRSRAL